MKSEKNKQTKNIRKITFEKNNTENYTHRKNELPTTTTKKTEDNKFI